MAESFSSDSVRKRHIWLALGFLGLGLSIAIGAYLARTAGRQRVIDARFVGPFPRGERSGLVESGQKWRFRVSPVHSGAEGVETWGVQAVGSEGVTIVVTGSGASPITEPKHWTFDLRVRPQGPVYLLGSEVIRVDGGTDIHCDVVECIDSVGGDQVRSWVAVSGHDKSIQFPGVVRQVRVESRGRRVVEWDLISVTPR